MPKEIFLTDFNRFACIGDSIVAKVSLGSWSTGLRLEARLYEDSDSGPPDTEQDGFWPSLDPDSAGYIGPKSKATLAKEMRRAESIMQAWRDDEWRYVGVAVRGWFDDIPLTDEYSHALWRVEMNYPVKGKRHPNAYLRTVANELAYECARESIRALTDMVESGQ